MILSHAPKNRHLEGMSLPQIAAQRGLSLDDTLCELLLDEDLKLGHVVAPPRSVALWRQLDRDAMELLSRPDYMVCANVTPAGSLPHPRGYGAFPRFLGRLRREVGTLSLEEMVHRMTDRPARRFGLARRGRIEKGYFADLVVFDAEHEWTMRRTRIGASFRLEYPSSLSTAKLLSTMNDARASWLATRSPNELPSKSCGDHGGNRGAPGPVGQPGTREDQRQLASS
jgi:hypothetical protein